MLDCHICLRRAAVAAVAAALSAAAVAEQSALVWAESPTFVDTRDSAVRIAKPDASASYAVRYVDESAGDAAYVVVSKVVDADTASAVTSVVSRCEAGAEGSVPIAPQEGESRRFRLVHAAYAADGTALGDPLVADMAVAYPAAQSGEVTVDSRANSMQLVAETGGSAPLAYSSEWAAGGTPVRVEVASVLDRYSKGRLVTSATNTLLEVAAPATGSVLHRIASGGGTVTLLCRFFDVGGNLVGEPLTSTYRFDEKWGTCIRLR